MADKHQQTEDSYRAAKRGAEPGDRPTPTAAGVNANVSKDHLVEVAKKVGIDRPDKFEKTQLITAIRLDTTHGSRQPPRHPGHHQAQRDVRRRGLGDHHHDAERHARVHPKVQLDRCVRDESGDLDAEEEVLLLSCLLVVGT
jgi:hypothetical protein